MSLVHKRSSDWENKNMDKDRLAGSAKQIKGKIKEVSGKILGDAKLESEGKAEQVAGKTQNAVGGLKDTLKGE
ncbi:CsbD family protein [Methylocella silvestris]